MHGNGAESGMVVINSLEISFIYLFIYLANIGVLDVDQAECFLLALH